jgi:predicted transport protein
MKRTEVGSPINFRGFIYSPINEQGVVYLFGLVSEDLNIRVESIQQGYPDCTGIRYLGKGRWERVRIEFEYNSSHFLLQKHDPKGCDVIVCWNDDLKQEEKEKLAKVGVEIIDLKSRIGTDEIPNKKLTDPETASKKEFDIEHHYKRRDVTENVKNLFEKLDGEIKKLNPEIWDKYSKTTITYYSPEKVFIGVHLRKGSIGIEVYTNTEQLECFENIPNHENWGRTTIHNEQELQKIIPSLKKSFEIMKKAEEEGINTGWYALTPAEKMTWKATDENEEDLEEEHKED